MRFKKSGVAVGVTVLAFLALLGAWVFDSNAFAVSPVESEADREYALSASAARATAIAFYEKRLAEDPVSALDMAQLAALNLEEGRVTGSFGALSSAEELARRSISTRSVRNSRSSALLVSILLAQHRFSTARDVAAALVREDPETIEYKAILAEVEMELGNYESARELLGSLYRSRSQLALAPRFARWIELNGAPDEAIRIAKRMRDETIGRVDLDPSRALWFHLRVIDLELRYGHIAQATQALAIARRVAPNDWRSHAAAARVELQRGRPKEAIALAERAVSIVADPTALALLADGYLLIGDTARALDLEDALEAAARAEPGPLHRGWSLRLLDKNRRIGEVLNAAIADTLQRRDIHGYDLLAWALYKSGRLAEANDAMQKALRLGTADPAFLFRAGVIAAKSGDRARAITMLEASLKVKAALAPMQAREAQSLLRTIRREETH